MYLGTEEKNRSNNWTSKKEANIEQINKRDAPFRSKMERWGHPFSFFETFFGIKKE